MVFCGVEFDIVIDDDNLEKKDYIVLILENGVMWY